MTADNYQTDNEFLRTAIEAARSAGELIDRSRGRELHVRHTGRVDLVTEVDLLAEQEIIRTIKEKYPGHRIAAEESGVGEEESDYVWWIDPIDGTTNFVHGYPHYAVSIALQSGGEIAAGVVYNPVNQELFSAARGEGAFLNGVPLKVSNARKLDESLLATGFPYDRDQRPRALSILNSLIVRVRGIRRDGSAALNLAYVAAGRLDGFWEFGLHPWDTAAGSLILKEAGGEITNFQGGDFDIRYPEVVATNRLIHRELLKFLPHQETSGETRGER